MNVLGLDLSITAPGFAWGDRVADMATLDCARLKIEGDQRYRAIRDNVRHILRNVTVGLAVLEGPAYAGMNMFQFGMVHGPVRTVLMDFEVPYVTVQPSALKKFATGRGDCDKTEMIAAVAAATGAMPGDDNQADAWWLREMGLAALGHPRVELTVERRQLLASVQDWPTVVNRWDFYPEDRKSRPKTCGHGYGILMNAGRWIHAFGLSECTKPDKKPARSRKGQ